MVVKLGSFWTLLLKRCMVKWWHSGNVFQVSLGFSEAKWHYLNIAIHCLGV